MWRGLGDAGQRGRSDKNCDTRGEQPTKMQDIGEVNFVKNMDGRGGSEDHDASRGGTH